MPVPDAETPPPAAAPIAVDNTVPGLSITATVVLTGTTPFAGGTVSITVNGRTFATTYDGSYSSVLGRARDLFGIESGPGRRALSRVFREACAAALEVYLVEGRAQDRAALAALMEGIPGSLALAPAAVAA